MSSDKKILFVDDDSDFLESTQLMLMDEGYDVVPATNGEEAVAKYKEIKPDIVFLDIKMPGIDGYETFFRITFNCFYIPNEFLGNCCKKSLSPFYFRHIIHFCILGLFFAKS